MDYVEITELESDEDLELIVEGDYVLINTTFRARDQNYNFQGVGMKYKIGNERLCFLGLEESTIVRYSFDEGTHIRGGMVTGESEKAYIEMENHQELYDKFYELVRKIRGRGNTYLLEDQDEQS